MIIGSEIFLIEVSNSICNTSSCWPMSRTASSYTKQIITQKMYSTIRTDENHLTRSEHIPLWHAQALLRPFLKLHCLFPIVSSSCDLNRHDSDIFQSPATAISFPSISSADPSLRTYLSISALFNDLFQGLNAFLGLLSRLDYP